MSRGGDSPSQAGPPKRSKPACLPDHECSFLPACCSLSAAAASVAVAVAAADSLRMDRVGQLEAELRRAAGQLAVFGEASRKARADLDRRMGSTSRWREFRHSANITSPSLLRHLLQGEGWCSRMTELSPTARLDLGRAARAAGPGRERRGGGWCGGSPTTWTAIHKI